MEGKEGTDGHVPVETQGNGDHSFLDSIRSRIRAMVHRDEPKGLEAHQKGMEARLKAIDRLDQEGTTDNMVDELENISEFKKNSSEE